MNFGFYGDSKACWAKNPIHGTISFIDKICKHFKSNLVNVGVPQGSEERALTELKSTKKVDVAFIFHSRSSRFYIPQANRDIDIRDFNSFFADTKAKYIWENQKKIQDEFFDYGGIKEKFVSLEDFINTLSLYKKYLHDPDVHQNRWYGALIQIDQFLTSKKIPAIHVIRKDLLPPWFKFNSGIVSYSIDELFDEHHKIGLPNNVSIEGQDIIANALIPQVNALLKIKN